MNEPGCSLNIDQLPIDIISDDNVPVTENNLGEVIEKYKSGEISFDNYEFVFDGEEPLEKQQEQAQEVKEVKSRRRGVRKVPPHVKALIGEANIRYARGDHETALKMCFEIIRQNPNMPEPYLTLAQIYEGQHDYNNCLKYTFLAATCSTRDVDLWIQLAELHLKFGNKKEAITAYSSAINANPYDVELHLKRIELLESIEDDKNVLRAYVRLLNYLSSKDGKLLNIVAIKVAREYNKLNEIQKAIDYLNVCFQKPNHVVTPEVVNIMLELLLIVKNYSQCLDMFVQHCNIDVELLVGEKGIEIVSYNMPDDINIDLKIKFVICAIHLGSTHLYDQLLTPLLLSEDQVDTVGDLFLDVAEALMIEKQSKEALKFLVPLIKSNNYSLPAVWLKYADCLNECELYEQAVENYQVVMRMAPLHTEVKYNLASVLLKLNKREDALNVLEQNVENPIDVGILVQRVNLLKSMKRYDEFLDSVQLLLSRHCISLKYYDELGQITYNEVFTDKLERISMQREMRGEIYADNKQFICEREPSVEDEYRIFRQALQIAKNRKNYSRMQLLAFTGLASNKFRNKREMDMYGFLSCILNRDPSNAYKMIRSYLNRTHGNRIVWNWFNMLLQFSPESRHLSLILHYYKFKKMREFLDQIMLNYFLADGKNSIAINQCLKYLTRKPTPLKCLTVGCYVMHLLHNDLIEDRTDAIRFLFYLFMHYSQTRTKLAKEEVNYNLGRFFHAAGILHVAEHYYKLVLRSKIRPKAPYLTLKREAAFNLHLIYKRSKNLKLARYILLKYIQI